MKQIFGYIGQYAKNLHIASFITCTVLLGFGVYLNYITQAWISLLRSIIVFKTRAV
ncbi:hypothetical protein [Polluticaenibacter yanchengensis]|uniref:Uncharacterized protein n=1 Tax=Polluticaenibacter yanchengensis TaxID=3014562 RepID=A0ABT4UF67_9BACT|nr:hypothetical protein [Chitinophagaceae bacterium LY-5]